MGTGARRLAAALALLLLLPATAWAAGDPYRDQQWALDTIEVDRAWEVSRGAGAVVAVIDTGIDTRHPDLRDRILRDESGEVVGVDLVDGGTPEDRHGHGTLVAGVIAASEGNSEGIAGVAPRASIMPIRVLDDVGSGRGSNVDTGIRWAVDHGADVINLSLESVKGPDGASEGPGAPTAAVRYAWEQGVVVVAASGNNGASVSDYPEESPVLLVGATDEQDRPADFSDRGRGDAVLAPGMGIISTWCRASGDDGCSGDDHTYGVAEGTSFAAPHVAGLAALLSADGLDAREIVARIRSTTTSVDDPSHGQGRIDAGAALHAPRSDTESEGGGLVAASEEVGEPASEPREPRPAPEPAASPEPAPEPDPEPEPVEVPEVEVEEPVASDGDGDSAPEPEPSPSASSPPPGELAGRSVDVPSEKTPAGEVALQLLAAGLIGTTLASWSAVARREG